MTNDAIKEKLQQIDAVNLREILLSVYKNNPSIHGDIDVLIAVSSDNAKAAISAIKKEISSLKRSTRFIDYSEGRDFSFKLDNIRDSILNLSTKYPSDAFALMKDFLKTHESTINRCDDSDGVVSGSYHEVCRELGEIGKLANISVDKAVEIVFEMFTENPYGICDGIIRSFKDVLGNEGLELLKAKLISQLSKEKIEKETARQQEWLDSDEKETISIESLKECRKDAIGSISRNISRGICEIADCRNNVDEYIEGCAFPKKSRNYDSFYDSDKEEIAERMIAHNRAAEALEWLSKIKAIKAWHSKSITLKIAALELLGRKEEAQQERISWFDSTLSHQVFEEIMNHSTLEFQEEFCKEAIKKAFASKSDYSALTFLVQGKFLDACSDFVQSKIDSLSGEFYTHIRPAANFLLENHPLSAMLLYRKLIEYVMNGAKSKYYGHATKDMIACEKLSETIDDYKTFKAHEAYFAEFQEKHKRKPAFWLRYKEEMAKQLKKAKKAIG